MKAFKYLLPSLCLFSFTFSTFALDHPIQKQWEKLEQEIIEKKEKFRGQVQAGLFEKLEGLMDSFGKDFFDDFFEDDFFKDDFFEDFDFPRDRRMKSFGRWEETPESMVFILALDSPKNAPLDIKVREGRIIISGTFIERNEKEGAGGKGKISSQRTFQVNQTYLIHEGVDANNPKFLKSKGEIKIIFKKLKDFRKKRKTTNPQKKLTPLKPNSFHKTI